MRVCEITTTTLANVIDVECRLDYCVQVSSIYIVGLSVTIQ